MRSMSSIGVQVTECYKALVATSFGVQSQGLTCLGTTGAMRFDEIL